MATMVTTSTRTTSSKRYLHSILPSAEPHLRTRRQSELPVFSILRHRLTITLAPALPRRRLLQVLLRRTTVQAYSLVRLSAVRLARLAHWQRSSCLSAVTAVAVTAVERLSSLKALPDLSLSHTRYSSKRPTSVVLGYCLIPVARHDRSGRTRKLDTMRQVRRKALEQIPQRIQSSCQT